MGRVMNLRGQPVAGVKLEIWQANAAGKYTHPNDLNPAPVDPNFEGYATVVTDSEGRYRFKTVRPGAYPVVADYIRPPHIHFDITGQVNRLITQMYFPVSRSTKRTPCCSSRGAKRVISRKFCRLPPKRSRVPSWWSGIFC